MVNKSQCLFYLFCLLTLVIITQIWIQVSVFLRTSNLPITHAKRNVFGSSLSLFRHSRNIYILNGWVNKWKNEGINLASLKKSQLKLSQVALEVNAWTSSITYPKWLKILNGTVMSRIGPLITVLLRFDSLHTGLRSKHSTRGVCSCLQHHAYWLIQLAFVQAFMWLRYPGPLVKWSCPSEVSHLAMET